ncbi:MAG: NADH-quinone oxidoreductase subunit NuoE [Bdellovibrionaceae bacterium]|nr:NADH-quinone oxidoreductase subunit NuoE [Pseudobdellovibrionaceae bacterium]|tara:strand:- start:3630 stop:4103 length:474 start_codon:yes stop_codon:yes gene_type:complete
MAKVLSDQFYSVMKKLEPRYPNKVALMLPALHAAQEEMGWLPPESLDEIADYIGCHPAQVREVASFYTMYNLKPVGKHHIKICTNVACCLRGAYDLVDHCEKKLGIKVGQTTDDRKFTLHEEECLGACGTAPAMMLDDDYHENLDTTRLDELLDSME